MKPPKKKKTTTRRVRRRPDVRKKKLAENDAFSLEDFRRKFPQAAPNRFRVGETEEPLTLFLEGGSAVTKGRGAALLVEIGAAGFRVELRSG